MPLDEIMREMLVLLSILAAMQLGNASAPVGSRPSSVAGLVAHFDANALRRQYKHGATVDKWTDLSGGGHHLLTEHHNDLPLFRVDELGGMPIVQIFKGNRFKVARPFELGDHTIFLVHSAKQNESTLFSDKKDDRRGLILALRGRTHSYQVGEQGDVHYNAPRSLSLDYGITVLGRQAGVLKAFINGVEYSSNSYMDEPMRFGRMFYMRASTNATRDGDGLRIAELIVYDRLLEKSERGSVTDYLSAKYGLEVELSAPPRKIVEPGMQLEMGSSSAMAQMSSRSDTELNEEIVVIEWQSVTPIAAPLAFDGEIAPAEIHCGRDATRVRLKLVMPLLSPDAGVELRGLFLRNAEEYHPEEIVSGPFTPTADGYSGELRLSTKMTLEAGDFIQFIVTRAGGDGSIRIAPSGAQLLIEPLE